MTVVINGTTGISPVTASGTSALVDGMTVGRGAGEVSTNTAVGASALAANTTGSRSVAVGDFALTANTTGYRNVALGSEALTSNTTGYYNTGLGWRALNVNTTGNENTASGYYSLLSNTTGSFNTAYGGSALQSNTTSSNNVAVGYQAMYSYQTGGDNVAVGVQAGYSINGNGNSTFVGRSAGYSTTGGGNTFLGYYAGYSVTTGTKNTIVGRFNGNDYGLNISASSNYIVLSDGDGNPCLWREGTSGAWRVGLGGAASSYEGVLILNGSTASNRGAAIQGGTGPNWYFGDYGYVVNGTSRFLAMSNSGGGGVYLNGTTATSWTAVSDETRKVIIEPITDAANKVATLRTVIGRLKTDDETVRRPYLIAQDVQAVLPEAVSESEDKEGSVLGLSYTEVIPLLVAAIKELKAEIDILKGK